MREIVRIPWRQKQVIIGTVFVLTLLALVVLELLPPLYTATSTVTLNATQMNVVDIPAVLAGLRDDISLVPTEAAVIQSRDLAAKIIVQLNLDKNPEFNVALQPPTWLSSLNPMNLIPSDWLALMLGPPPVLTPAQIAELQRSSTIDVFLSDLVVTAVSGSRAVTIAFTSQNARMSAQIANALADTYIVSQLQDKLDATRKANDWLKEQLAQLRQTAEESQRLLQSYRQKSGLLMADPQKQITLATQEAAAITAQLTDAQAKRLETEALLHQAEQALSIPGGIESIPAVLDSQLIQTLRAKEAEIAAALALLSQQYGQNHPNVVNARNQLRDIRKSIAIEAGHIVDGLRNQVAAAAATEANLKTRLSQVTAKLGETNQAQGELNILTGEATANQALFDTFTARTKQTGTEIGVGNPDARVISRADAPIEPSFPNKKILMILSIAASGFLGVVLAFVSELLDEGIRSMDQIEAYLGVTALGLVPALRKFKRHGVTPEDYLLKHPSSAFAESIRSFIISLSQSNGGQLPKKVLITSSVPAEGKSTLTISLARMLASADKKVIIVDCDVRRPHLHQSCRTHLKPGLADYLRGKVLLADIVRRDAKSTVDILTAGSTMRDPSSLFDSIRMKEMLEELAKSYDVVVVNSAPVLAVADARILCCFVDRTVFLVRWGETRREAAVKGLQQVANANGNVAGVLLTMVNVKKHAQYGFADSGYYHGALAKYYSS